MLFSLFATYLKGLSKIAHSYPPHETWKAANAFHFEEQNDTYISALETLQGRILSSPRLALPRLHVGSMLGTCLFPKIYGCV